MYAVVVVHVGDRLQTLPDDVSSERGGTAARVAFQLVQHSVLAELEDQMQPPLSAKHLDQVHQVRVFQRLQHTN